MSQRTASELPTRASAPPELPPTSSPSLTPLPLLSAPPLQACFVLCIVEFNCCMDPNHRVVSFLSSVLNTTVMLGVITLMLLVLYRPAWAARLEMGLSRVSLRQSRHQPAR